MVKVKNRKNSGLADKVHNKRKGDITKKKLNPFEVHINKEKLKVLGKKSKHDRGLPGVSRAKAIQKRKDTLGIEMKLMNKTNTFLDRRIGEKDTQLSAEDKILARFAAERAKQHTKKNIYNLADDEILTHRGQTLEQIEKFDDPRSDEEDDDEKRFGGLNDDFVAEGHFGGGMLSRTDAKDGAKSHKDLIEQLIAESKKRKAEKQKEKEQTLDLTEKLDNEWKDLQPVVFKKARIEKTPESAIEKVLDKAEKRSEDYDKMTRELRFEKRGTPSDGLKSEEKQQKEEKERLEKLEQERLQRMLGEDEIVKPKVTNAFKHRSADDLDDNFDLEDEKQFMLAYDNEGKPLVPEHVLNDYSVPNARNKFNDGVSDTSSEDDDDESSDADQDDDDEPVVEGETVKNNDKGGLFQNNDSSDDESVEESNLYSKTNLTKSPKIDKVANGVESSDDDNDSEESEQEKENFTKVSKSTKINDSLTKKEDNKDKNIQNKSKEDKRSDGNLKEKGTITLTKKKATTKDLKKQNDDSSSEESESSDGGNDDKDDEESVGDKIINQKDDLKALIESEDESNDEELGDNEAVSLFDLQSSKDINLKELLSDKTPSQQSTALQKLIKSYDPGLNAKNKDLLTRLFAHMLQYINDIFTNVQDEGEILKSFLIFDKIAPHFYDLAHTNKVSSKKFMSELLKEKHDKFLKNRKKVPDLDTLIFFKLVSLVFPTSDLRHPLTTPSLIFMCEILTMSRFTDAYSISRGLFITSLILEYTVLSKRFVPEAVNFLRGVLFLSVNVSVLNPIQVVPPFKQHTHNKLLNLEHDRSKMEVNHKMAAKDFVLKELNDDFKIRCLGSATMMLNEFFNNYNEFDAQPVIFETHIQLLNRIDLELYPKKVESIISKTLKHMKESIETKTLNPMCAEKKKPKLLRMYEPDIQEVFTGSKSSKLSREQAETDRLKHKLKREMKGALREIRRDKAYIASVKIKQKIHSDNIRKDKVKQIYKDASIQQGELNKLKRMK